MLSTRIFTAVLLIAGVLAALFLLPPRAWAVAALIVIALGAHEWATLARFSAAARIAFVIATAALGMALLFAPAFRFDNGWSPRVVLVLCGAATVFWLLVVPPWLNFRWRIRSTFLAALVGALVLMAAWVAMVELQAQSP